MLRIPRPIYDQAIDHVRTCLPEEAAGILGGTTAGEVRCHIALPNSLGARAFFVDPYDQYKALRLLDRKGLVPIAIYHSHPGGGVGLSPHDRAFASRLPYLQVVIALNRPKRPIEAAAYRVVGASVEQIGIEIIEAR